MTSIVAFGSLTVPERGGVVSLVNTLFTVRYSPPTPPPFGAVVSYVTSLSLKVAAPLWFVAASWTAAAGMLAMTVPSELIPDTETA